MLPPHSCNQHICNTQLGTHQIPNNHQAMNPSINALLLRPMPAAAHGAPAAPADFCRCHLIFSLDRIRYARSAASRLNSQDDLTNWLTSLENWLASLEIRTSTVNFKLFLRQDAIRGEGVQNVLSSGPAPRGLGAILFVLIMDVLLKIIENYRALSKKESNHTFS